MKKQEKRFTEITGQARVHTQEFKNKKGTYLIYSVSVGKKDKDGEWKNCYIPVYFSKEAEKAFGKEDLDENGNANIEITQGWLTVHTYKDKDEVALFISDFE